MKTEKMSFKNIKDVLSRDEMKGIMAGSGGGINCTIIVTHGGVNLSIGGACAESSIDHCNSVADGMCSQHASWGASQCTRSCY